MSQKPHVSYSQLSMLFRCGEQYRRRYVEKDIRPPGIALHIGSGVDEGANDNFRQKIETHKDLPDHHIVESAVTAYEESIERSGLEVGPGKSAKDEIGEGKDQTVFLATTLASQVVGDYQPIAVQARSLIELPEATHDLLGYTDLRDDKGRVVDLKTASRVVKSAADLSLQLTAYYTAYIVDMGHEPSELRLDILKKKGKSSPKERRVVLSTQRTRRDVGVLASRINAALNVIKTGAFAPCNQDDWVCSKRWCGYADDCPYWGGQE